VSTSRDVVKRLFIGRALASNRLGDTLLSKKIALPVFCSDPISSVAYATEQILLVLGAAGAASFLGLATPIAALITEWDSRGIGIALTVIDSPYREVTRPVLDYIKRLKRDSPRDVVTVFIPEYVVGHWWEQLLHNQSALRLKGRLLYQPGVMVTSVPYQLHSSTEALTKSH